MIIACVPLAVHKRSGAHCGVRQPLVQAFIDSVLYGLTCGTSSDGAPFLPHWRNVLVSFQTLVLFGHIDMMWYQHLERCNPRTSIRGTVARSRATNQPGVHIKHGLAGEFLHSSGARTASSLETFPLDCAIAVTSPRVPRRRPKNQLDSPYQVLLLSSSGRSIAHQITRWWIQSYCTLGTECITPDSVN